MEGGQKQVYMSHVRTPHRSQNRGMGVRKVIAFVEIQDIADREGSQMDALSAEWGLRLTSPNVRRLTGSDRKCRNAGRLLTARCHCHQQASLTERVYEPNERWIYSLLTFIQRHKARPLPQQQPQ